MAKYFFTKKAVEDFSEIWNYTIKAWSECQAEKYYAELINTCKLISDDPNIGKTYDEIVPEIFGLKMKKHIIFYRNSKRNNIEILRILHEKMDLKKKLKN
ncbi:MAG: type II toxin-antitoxin system RelE/ParE family toxin [Bacteroidota bacterium]